MNDWRLWPYPFPADDGMELLWEVLDRVPDRFGADLDWTLTDKLIVAVSDIKAAVYLRMAFDGGRLLGKDGVPILEQHEVLIAMGERDECESLLASNCRAEAEWFSLVVISTRTDAAHIAFDDAYRAVFCGTPLNPIVQPDRWP